MKLYFMKSKALSYFKGNVENNYMKYLNDTNDWMFEQYKEYSGEESPFEEFKFEVKDFKMNVDFEKIGKSDIENTKILHTALKNISLTQAADERFWVGLAHSEFYDFLKKRLKLDEKIVSESKILRNFYFSLGKRRSLIVNVLSRYWWIGHMIYDEDSDTPYAGIEFLEKDFAGRILTLFSSSYTANPKITRAFLKGLFEIEESGVSIDVKQFREVIRFVNILGSFTLLDYLSENELKEKIKEHFYKVN